MTQTATPPHEVVSMLRELCAEDIGHHAGRSLLEHLSDTYALLAAWHAPRAVALAGLCHSVYSTSEFGDARLDIGNRERVRAVIGAEAERLAYLFCTLERASFLDRLGSGEMESRFDGGRIPISERETRAMCEILLANELDLAIAKKGADRPDKIAKKVGPCFAMIEAYVSDAARAAYRAATEGVLNG